MLLLKYVCHDKALPVQGEHIRAAHGVCLYAASGLARLQQEVHLRVMTQRLEMSDPFDRYSHRLLIYYPALTKLNIDTEPFRDLPPQDIQLDPPHEAYAKLAGLLVPLDIQQRVFILKLFQLTIKIHGIHAFRKNEAVVEDRLKNRGIDAGHVPQALP